MRPGSLTGQLHLPQTNPIGAHATVNCLARFLRTTGDAETTNPHTMTDHHAMTDRLATKTARAVTRIATVETTRVTAGAAMETPRIVAQASLAEGKKRNHQAGLGTLLKTSTAAETSTRTN